MSLFAELKRRNVFRVAIAYVVLSWLLLQVVDVVAPLLGLSDAYGRGILLLLALGFLPALFFAWAYELTPEGLRRESEVDRNTSITHHTGRRLDLVTLIALVLVVSFVVYDRSTRTEPTVVHEGAQEVEKGSGSFSDAEDDLAVPRGENEPDPLSEPDTRAAESETSIAVLPFVNMSSDPEQEYFSDGITEELLNRLTQIPGLRVAARTSSFQFKGQSRDVSQIGEALRVNHVLEGSVRKAGNRLRITAQLIKVGSGFHLWSETFERELTDVFAVQDEISAAITNALRAELTSEPISAKTGQTDNLEAFDLYLRARHLLYRREADNMHNAAELFDRAIEIDPQFADAYGAAAFNWALLPGYSTRVSGREGLEKTREYGARALAIDPDQVEALTALGHVETMMGWNFDQGREYFDRAMSLAAGNAEVANLYGDHLWIVGDFSEALRIERLAYQLDPLSPVHPSDLSGALTGMREFDEAIEWARVGIKLAPGSPGRMDSLVIALAQSGQIDRARSEVEAFLSEYPDTEPGWPISWRMQIAYHSGDREQLRSLIERGRSLETDWLDAPMGLYLLELGDVEGALQHLERAYRAHDAGLVFPDLFYQPLRQSKDPRWQAFWQRPELVRLLELRRRNGDYENIGIWRGWSLEQGESPP